MNKKERLEKIRRFVTDYQIGTQEEIVEHLREAGISATQATVSRDIKELGIVKIPLKDNTYIYELPKSVVRSLQLAENISYYSSNPQKCNKILSAVSMRLNKEDSLLQKQLTPPQPPSPQEKLPSDTLK